MRFYIGILIATVITFISFCGSIDNQIKILVQKFDNTSASDIFQILGIDKNLFIPTLEDTAKCSGYYSYLINENDEKVLSGDFRISHLEKVSNDPQMNYVFSQNFEGRLLDGRLVGEFKQDYYAKDEYDWDVNYLITLLIDTASNNCESATFNGHIGPEMTDTSVVINNIDTCSFDWVVLTVWRTWIKEWNKKPHEEK